VLPNLRQAIWTAAVATTFAVFVATSVYVDIAHVRVKLVERSIEASDGRVVVSLNDRMADDLIAPWALIARVRHASATPMLFRVTVGGEPACERSVSAGGSTRIDCAVTGPWRRASEAPEIGVVAAGPWTLEYLEIATHHGNTTGPLMSYVIPADGATFVRPSRLWGFLTFAAVAALLLLGPATADPVAVQVASRVVGALALSLIAIVLVAPLVSAYRVVIWTGTVVEWVVAIGVLRLVYSLSTRITVPQVAGLLTIGMFVLTASMGTRALSGADSYGYVSQADLWLRGDLKIPQPFTVEAPWPNADRAFAPLGYQPSPQDNRVIVPTYAPGLPLLLALAKRVGGQTAMHFVVPFSTAVLVLATFGLDRRLGSDTAGLIGAYLLAASPVLVTYALVAMTDMPVAAAWAVAFYAALGRSACATP